MQIIGCCVACGVVFGSVLSALFIGTCMLHSYPTEASADRSSCRVSVIVLWPMQSGMHALAVLHTLSDAGHNQSGQIETKLQRDFALLSLGYLVPVLGVAIC